jgi:hypothetical protein
MHNSHPIGFLIVHTYKVNEMVLNVRGMKRKDVTPMMTRRTRKRRKKLLLIIPHACFVGKVTGSGMRMLSTYTTGRTVLCSHHARAVLKWWRSVAYQFILLRSARLNKNILYVMLPVQTYI